jgi:uncharacterized protein YkwD
MKHLITLAFILLTVLGYSQTKPSDPIKLNSLDTLFLEKLVLEEINEHRKRHRLSSFDILVWNDNIGARCRKYSQWLNDNNKFEHSKNFDEGEKINTGQECILLTYLYSNVETYQQAAARFANAWKTSPGHNAALLREYYNMGGIGISIKDRKSVILTYRVAQKIDKNDPRFDWYFEPSGEFLPTD